MRLGILPVGRVAELEQVTLSWSSVSGKAALHWTVAPIQLQVTITDILLKPGHGLNGNILLPAPTCLKREERVQWTWPLKIKVPHCQWVGPSSKGLEVNLQVIFCNGRLATKITVRCPTGETDEEEHTILRGTFALSLWPIMSSPTL
uniref:Uncharacterized protein n=1 Tax=Rousettus aegyptiacus TaxID=9407 RepID=A0A7J8H0Y5_ROUAE|nr:hypothetical protein HJG63_011251 [Rousettus aegyptiacus]